MIEKLKTNHSSKLYMQQLQSRLSYTSLEYSQELDLQYLRIRQQICATEFYITATKHLKIRLRGWLNRLDNIITNPVWKKNRNRYVKLINLMCQCEIMISPFNWMPPNGDIPNLTKHEMNKIIDSVERAVKNQKERLQIEEYIESKKSSKITERPDEHWEKIKSMRSNCKASYRSQDNNAALDRFIENLPLNRQQLKKEQQYEKQQRIKQLNNSNDKQNYDYQETKQNKTSFQPKLINRQSKSHFKTPPKFLSIHLSQNTDSNSKQSNYFVKNTRIKTECIEGSNNFFQSTFEPPIAHRYNHESVDLVSQTLITQILDQTQSQSITQQEVVIFQEQPTSRTADCNFNEDLSERCRTKQQVLVQNYFVWKKQAIERDCDKVFKKNSKPRVIELNFIHHPQPLDSEFRNISVYNVSQDIVEAPLSKCIQYQCREKSDSWKQLNESMEVLQNGETDLIEDNLNFETSHQEIDLLNNQKDMQSYDFNTPN